MVATHTLLWAMARKTRVPTSETDSRVIVEWLCKTTENTCAYYRQCERLRGMIPMANGDGILQTRSNLDFGSVWFRVKVFLWLSVGYVPNLISLYGVLWRFWAFLPVFSKGLSMQNISICKIFFFAKNIACSKKMIKFAEEWGTSVP